MDIFLFLNVKHLGIFALEPCMLIGSWCLICVVILRKNLCLHNQEKMLITFALLFGVVLLLVVSDLFLILKANVVENCHSGPQQLTLFMKKMFFVPLSLREWVSGPNLLDMLT